MDIWVWAVFGAMAVLIAVLILKIHLLRKSAGEISRAFEDRLSQNTNTLIDISSRDRCMRSLAADINRQLRLLRQERQRYQQGDAELKAAVTNISHDLRTPLTAICGYLELLAREDCSERARRYLDIIRGRADSLRELTEELFRYSVIVSEEKEPELEAVSLNAALAESMTNFGFDRALYGFEREGFSAIRDAYKARCVNLGRHVTFDGGEGTALDVDEEGRLVVQGAEGSTHVFTGEVSVHGIYGAV